MTEYSLEVFPVGSFQCNCVILSNPESKKSLIVDPGGDGPIICERVKKLPYPVTIIWHSHAHLDHIAATKEVFDFCVAHNAQKHGGEVPHIYLHQEDSWLWKNVAIQSSLLGLETPLLPDSPQKIANLQELDRFSGLLNIHTPGHTPGSCCLSVKNNYELYTPGGFTPDSLPSEKNNLLLSGDTLFRRSIGRTDLWGGDFATLESSIQKRLYSLDDNTTVIPGHGPLTLLGAEKEKNPFVKHIERNV